MQSQEPSASLSQTCKLPFFPASFSDETLFGAGKLSGDRMLKVADEASYAAKAAGRNTWELREVSRA